MNRLQEETGARIDIDRDNETCVCPAPPPPSPRRCPKIRLVMAEERLRARSVVGPGRGA